MKPFVGEYSVECNNNEDRNKGWLTLIHTAMGILYIAHKSLKKKWSKMSEVKKNWKQYVFLAKYFKILFAEACLSQKCHI